MPPDPKLARAVAVSVARGMAYLHSRSPPILHLVRFFCHVFFGVLSLCFFTGFFACVLHVNACFSLRLIPRNTPPPTHKTNTKTTSNQTGPQVAQHPRRRALARQDHRLRPLARAAQHLRDRQRAGGDARVDGAGGVARGGRRRAGRRLLVRVRASCFLCVVLCLCCGVCCVWPCCARSLIKQTKTIIITKKTKHLYTACCCGSC